jgi:hypothetical protein
MQLVMFEFQVVVMEIVMSNDNFLTLHIATCEGGFKLIYDNLWCIN